MHERLQSFCTKRLFINLQRCRLLPMFGHLHFNLLDLPSSIHNFMERRQVIKHLLPNYLFMPQLQQLHLEPNHEDSRLSSMLVSSIQPLRRQMLQQLQHHRLQGLRRVEIPLCLFGMHSISDPQQQWPMHKPQLQLEQSQLHQLYPFRNLYRLRVGLLSKSRA